MPVKFDPNDRDDVSSLLYRLDACIRGRFWFRTRPGTPAEIWAAADASHRPPSSGPRASPPSAEPSAP